MNTRLQQFLSAENITQAQFADSINVARAGISHIIAGRNKPGWDFIINTMNRYPNLNIEWLLTGRGKMYKTRDEEKPVSEPVRADFTLFGSDDYDADPAVAVPPLPRVKDKNPASQGRIQGFDSVAETPWESRSIYQPRTEGKPQIPQSEPAPTSNFVTPKPAKISKIIAFFDDGTFQELE